MKTKWTPGPLRVGRDTVTVPAWGRWDHYTIVSDTGKLRQESVDRNDTIHLCTARCSKEGDAILYSLAPEMVEALRDILAAHDWPTEPHWTRARSLLARLEGGEK